MSIVDDALERIEPDLTTTYLGMELRCPVVASSSPLTGRLGSLRALDIAGVGAVVLPSLFEEQLDGPEAATGELDAYNAGPAGYLRTLRAARESLDVPVVASLNGTTRTWWTEYARVLADAGADAVELNVHRAGGVERTGRRVEDVTLDLVAAVAAVCPVPVAVKLSPYWSSLGEFAQRLVDAGARGVVLFDRPARPEVDIVDLRIGTRLELSSSAELGTPLRWTASLHGRVPASLGLTTGVHEPADVVRALLAGADVAMTASAILRHGPERVAGLVDGLRDWMAQRRYLTVPQLVGLLSDESTAARDEVERHRYLTALTRYARTFDP